MLYFSTVSVGKEIFLIDTSVYLFVYVNSSLILVKKILFKEIYTSKTLVSCFLHNKPVTWDGLRQREREWPKFTQPAFTPTGRLKFTVFRFVANTLAPKIEVNLFSCTIALLLSNLLKTDQVNELRLPMLSSRNVTEIL